MRRLPSIVAALAVFALVAFGMWGTTAAQAPNPLPATRPPAPTPTPGGAATIMPAPLPATKPPAPTLAPSTPTPLPLPATKPPAPTATPIPVAWWHPPVVTSWYWQLTGTLVTTRPETHYDVDGFNTSAATVAQLHALGKKVTCYISVGSWESFRPDAASFPASVKGNPLDPPFADELWLDTRSSVVRDLMVARIQMCKDKGFDAVEPDNVDGYTNNPGFPLTAATQIDFNTFIAASAHARGMAVWLKNDGAQVATLAPSFDGAVVEQCVQYNECAIYAPFVTAGKPVFAAEYSGGVMGICLELNTRNFNGALTSINLNGPPWTSCR